MSLRSIFFSYFTLFCLVYICECDIVTETDNNGFTIDLIHRESPESPLYEQLSSPFDHLVNSLKRSARRAHHLKEKLSKSKSKFKSQPEVDLINASGGYLMRYFIGTPPVPTISIVDTGSDVVWTQCSPCVECFNQTQPLFSPKKSASYKKVACNDSFCKSLNQTQCSRKKQNCIYHMLYGDGSFSSGMLGVDNFAFASASKRMTKIPNIVFGCGVKNGGLFSGVESGIFGLGGGKTSFVTQLGNQAQGKFSYCLVPVTKFSNSSKLNFGQNALVSGKGVVWTPLITRKGLETFYFFTWEGVSIGNKRISFQNSSHNSRAGPQEGNMIIDSGSTLTLLPGSLYAKMAEAISKYVKLKRIQDPHGILELCYETRLDRAKDFPKIVAHLKGADLKWGYENGFVRVSENCVCFAAMGTDGKVGIYGNLAQVNFLVGYDIWKKRLSFKATDCLRS